MAADLQTMQATIQKYRSPKVFNAPASAGGKALQAAAKPAASPLQPCFRSDFPKLSYPAVDVRALDV